MSKASYLVKVIRAGREQDYFEFWEKGVQVNDAGESLDSDAVGFVEVVNSMSKAEAINLVREKHPGLQIDAEATSRHE